jgi:TadE-like protein
MRLARLWRDRRGATAVEFALGLPILLGLTLGSIEIGYAAYAQSVLSGAARDAARAGLTGNGTRETRIANRVAGLMRAFPKTSSAPVTVQSRVYASFDDVDRPEPWADSDSNGSCNSNERYQDINGNSRWDRDMARTGLGGPGEVVAYAINYPLRPLFGFLGTVTGGTRSVNLTAMTIIRNEPFGAAVNPSVTFRRC